MTPHSKHYHHSQPSNNQYLRLVDVKSDSEVNSLQALLLNIELKVQIAKTSQGDGMLSNKVDMRKAPGSHCSIERASSYTFTEVNNINDLRKLNKILRRNYFQVKSFNKVNRSVRS